MHASIMSQKPNLALMEPYVSLKFAKTCTCSFISPSPRDPIVIVNSAKVIPCEAVGSREEIHYWT